MFSTRIFPSYYLQHQWFNSPVRNIQLFFILYTTIMTVVVDLNIAVVSGTIFFYVSKYFWKVQDVESDFEQISEQEAKLITG